MQCDDVVALRQVAGSLFNPEHAWRPVGSWRWIVGTQRIILSSEIAGFFGMRGCGDEIRLDHAFARILPEDRHLVRELLVDITAGQLVRVFMLRVVDVSGAVVDLRCEAKARVNRHGHVTEVVSDCSEFVATKRRQELLAS